MGTRGSAGKKITVNGTDIQIAQEVDPGPYTDSYTENAALSHPTGGLVTGVLVYDPVGGGHVHFYYDVSTGLFGSHLKMNMDEVGQVRFTTFELDSIKEELQRNGYFNFEI